MGQILKSGSAATGTIEVLSSCSSLYVRAHADAVISINGFSFPLSVADTYYHRFDIDFNQIVVVSGSIDYVAVG